MKVQPTPPGSLAFELMSPEKDTSLFFTFDFEHTSVAASASPGRKPKYLFSRFLLGMLITIIWCGSGLINNGNTTGIVSNHNMFSFMPAIEGPVKWSTFPVATAPDKTIESITTTASPMNENSLTTTAIVSPSSAVIEWSPIVSAPDAELPDARLISSLFDPLNPVADSRASLETPAEHSSVTARNETESPEVILATAEKTITNAAPVRNRHIAITSEEFHSVTQLATMDGKKVLLKFGAAWCLPCRVMEETVFQDPDIRQKLSADYHTLTIDVDNLDGLNLKQFYNVQTLPAFVILNSNKDVIRRYQEAKTTDEMKAIL